MTFVALLHTVALAATISGKVVAVADGDTLTVLTADKQQVRVRLAEIDAPEKAQAFGEKAKQALSRMAFGRDVRVDVQTTDRYGRSVGRVFAGATDVNAELVRAGMAWAYRRYLRDKSLLDLELDAKTKRRGLWGGPPSPIAPWDFRRRGRTHGSRSDRMAATQSPTDSGMGTVVCGTKRYCREMKSCAEARAYLTQCSIKSLDGDGDGVPCETLCR